MKQRVMLASNRGPISYHFGADGTLTGRRGGGGLISGVTSGLAGMTAESEVTWVCAPFSDADRAAARRQDAADGGDTGDAGDAGDVALPEGLSGPAGVRVRMLDIAPQTFDRAYNNVANSVLWFVHHLLFDTPNQPRFGLEFRRDWRSYLAYNEAFAAAMADEARADEARVPVRALIQDYHLSLAPRMLRQRLGQQLAGRPGGTPGRYRRSRHRALLAHPVGAAGLLPDAARRGRPGRAGRNPGRGSRGLPRRPVGGRVPGLLRGDPGRAGDQVAGPRHGAGRLGAVRRPRHRGGRPPARHRRRRAARPGRSRRCARSHHRAEPGGPRPQADRPGRPGRSVH